MADEVVPTGHTPVTFLERSQEQGVVAMPHRVVADGRRP